MYGNGNGSHVPPEVVIHVTPYSFLYGEYAAATVLVSFCVLLGKVTTLQLIIMALIEVTQQDLNVLSYEYQIPLFGDASYIKNNGYGTNNDSFGLTLLQNL